MRQFIPSAEDQGVFLTSYINVTLCRANDQRTLKVLFTLDYEKEYNHYMLSFKCNSEAVDVISTSSGNIDEEGNVKSQDSKIELFVDYCEFGSELECLVGYYKGNELLDYETLTSYFDNAQVIKTAEIKIPCLKTIPASFKDRFEDFCSALATRKSSWNIQISCREDVFLDIISQSNTLAMATFGENTRNVLASDYVFRLDPNVRKLILPIEIIAKQYPKYTPQCQLGVFEVIEPDFMGAQGTYYKSLISNLITLSDIAKT